MRWPSTPREEKNPLDDAPLCILFFRWATWTRYKRAGTRFRFSSAKLRRSAPITRLSGHETWITPTSGTLWKQFRVLPTNFVTLCLLGCWLRRKNCFKSMVWVILMFFFAVVVWFVEPLKYFEDLSSDFIYSL